MSDNTVLSFLIAFSLTLIGIVIGIGVARTLTDQPRAPLNITCYSPDLAITYISVEPVVMANEYGVWKFASGKGAYIQNSGDTCIVEEVKQ